jgi:hypothetical protein
LVSKGGGAIRTVNSNAQTAGTREVQMVIKVPVSRYSELMAAIRNAGLISNESEQQNDVTKRYQELTNSIASTTQREQESSSGRLAPQSRDGAKEKDRARVPDSTDKSKQPRLSLEREREQLINEARFATITIMVKERVQ